MLRPLALLLVIIAGVLVLIAQHDAWGVAVVLLALLMSVCLHELGHYLMARRCGVKVSEYFVGFGPRLWSIRRNGVDYGVKALPLGGYVKIAGMNIAEQIAPEDEPTTYRQAYLWKKLAIVTAGPITNIGLCVILVWIGFISIGIPTNQPGVVVTRSSVDVLSPGDTIVRIGTTPVQTPQTLIKYLQRYRPTSADLGIITPSGSRRTIRVPIHRVAGGGYRMGISGTNKISNVRQNPIRAVGESVTRSWEILAVEADAVGRIFGPQGIHTYIDEITNRNARPTIRTERLSSPVGIVDAASQAQAAGWIYVILLIAVINLSLGVINLIPVPPLDGGHVAVAIYERIRSLRGTKHMVNPKHLAIITITVVSILLVIALASIYLDITKPLPNPFN